MFIRQSPAIVNRFCICSVSVNQIFFYWILYFCTIGRLRKITVGNGIGIISVICNRWLGSGHFRIAAIQMNLWCKALCIWTKSILVVVVIPDFLHGDWCLFCNLKCPGDFRLADHSTDHVLKAFFAGCFNRIRFVDLYISNHIGYRGSQYYFWDFIWIICYKGETAGSVELSLVVFLLHPGWKCKSEVCVIIFWNWERNGIRMPFAISLIVVERLIARNGDLIFIWYSF